MRISKLSTVAAIALAVAACGGGGGAATGGANPTNAPAGATADAGGGATPTAAAVAGTPAAPAVVAAELCATLSAADLKTATTKAYSAGVPDDFGSCTWTFTGETSSDGSRIFAAIQDATLDYIKGAFAGGTDLTVAGHPAYWNLLQDTGSVWVDVNGRLFVLSISPGTADSQASMVALAGVAAPKL
jgi:hypothetical protein